MTKLSIYRTHPNVVLPDFQTKDSACFDLSYNNAGKKEYTAFNKVSNPVIRVFSDERLFIGPGERVMVPTGLIMDIPVGYSVRIHPRSSTALKKGLILINSEGIIDSDYVEEVFLLMVNTTDVGITLRNNERIAQAEMVKLEKYTIESSDRLPTIKTDRKGGIGSTGAKDVEPTKVEA
jgi:dUTP pyrophosphatase